MKETSFIEQNKQKWNRFEQLYESKSNDPEELSDLYMDITDDLSYAQTFYKRRTVRVYLNQLAQKVYMGVHKQKGESLKKFITVWKTSLPLEIYRSRKNLLFALVLFLIYATIGAVSTHMFPGFADLVLGSGYVDMTMENIQKGNPLAVYAENAFDGQLGMFIGITTNNIGVAFMTFFFGFFLSIGTHILLFSNSVMVGTFQFFFHTKGLLVTAFLGIWIHGAFEISAIVLAAGAGFTVGNGLLFPGSYTRLQALQISTKRGLKIMLSLIPFLIVAGFFESFVTANYQELPDWSKWALILFSFGMILFFYVFYPIYVARKHPELVHDEEVPEFKVRGAISFSKIRDIAEMLSDSFRMYREKFAKFATVILLIALPLIVLMVTLQDISLYELQQKQHWYDWASQLEFMIGYGFHEMQDLFILLGWTVVFTIIYCAVLWAIKDENERFSWKSFFSYFGHRFFGVWLANSFLMIVVLLLPWWALLLAIFVLPFLLLNGPSAGLDDSKYGLRFKRGFKYGAQHYGKSLGLLIILLVFTALIAQPIAFVGSIHEGYTNEPGMRDLLDIVTDFVKRIVMSMEGDHMFWANVVRQFVYVIFIIGILPLFIIAFAFGYYNELERTEAKGLREAFKYFGKRSRTQETEADFE